MFLFFLKMNTWFSFLSHVAWRNSSFSEIINNVIIRSYFKAYDFISKLLHFYLIYCSIYFFENFTQNVFTTRNNVTLKWIHTNDLFIHHLTGITHLHHIGMYLLMSRDAFLNCFVYEMSIHSQNTLNTPCTNKEKYPLPLLFPLCTGCGCFLCSNQY